MAVVAAINTVVSILSLLPIRRRFGYFFYSTKYFEDMHKKKQELDSTANDMKTRKEQNDMRNVMVPHLVPSWLERAEVIDVNSISAGGKGFSHMKRRYKAGKRCYKVIKRIEGLMTERSNMVWTNEQIPLGMVSSATPQVPQDVPHNIINPNDQIPPGMASSSTPQALQDVPQTIIKSRQLIFQRALQLLEPDNPTQMVALCGMGGIGKTTMMEELKKVVENRKQFDRVLRVVIGKITGPIEFQDAIAEYTGGSLSESNKEARADRLKQRFLGMSQDGKKKILIILDDLWNIVDLKDHRNIFKLADVGLASPLPKGFKLFLTSRDEKLCDQMGVGTSCSILKLNPLKEAEAKKLFWEIISHSVDVVDRQKFMLGEDIVKRCAGLPIAIKTIALALRTGRNDAWSVTLSRLHRHDFHELQDLYAVIHDVFEISYDYLKNNDDKAIFVLSGLFPDDFDIPLEDLMRYGWGLKLFSKVYSLAEARQRTNTSVDNLLRVNMLVESDRIGCVKMHDLARSFILSNISKFKQASIVNHSDISEWPTEDTWESCERVLLKCKGMSEFPQYFDYPNLKLLKLMMNEKEPLIFPEDFYTRVKELQIISYRSILYPQLPISSQCSTNLRMLCFRSCSLNMYDLSYLGDLSNLEILSFAYCAIKNLPSTMGNLRKLKLLELIGCDKLLIGDGVFQKLTNLEELYMRNLNYKVIGFTKDNCEGLEKLSINLKALEVEFYQNIIRPENVSFKKLERFRISIGCHLDHIYDNDVYSYENTLRLVRSCEEVHAFEINQLFEKTEKLHLQVKDMNHVEDVLMHPSHQYSFGNLKQLSFENCANLKYLFTVNVANTLTNLERLTVKSCPVLEFLIYGENNRGEVIKFHKLKRLVLEELSMFVGLGNNIKIVLELPQLVELRLANLHNFTCIFASSKKNFTTTIPLLNQEVVCPKLEELEIHGMEKLKEIWACEEEDDRTPVLKEIIVDECDDIQNLFPKNPMRLLSHLEKLLVQNCGSIQALFDIESECFGQVNSSLRSIQALGLPKLREVWRIRGGEDNSGFFIRDFQTLEFIQINECKKFRNIVTPTTIKFDLGALIDISIDFVQDKKEISEVDNSRSVAVLFSSVHTLHHLSSIKLVMFKQVEVIFDIQIPSTVGIITSNDDEQPLLLPYLTVVKLIHMDSMTHLWKCNWSKFLMLHNSQQKSSFENLTTIYMENCDKIEYLFSPLMATLLSNLKKVEIKKCPKIEEVVSNRDDKDGIPNDTTNDNFTVIFPRLKSIILADLPNLKGFFFGMNDFQMRLLDEVIISTCPDMMVFTPLPLRAPKLKYIHINGDKYITPECCSLFMMTTLPQTPSQSLDNTNTLTTISEEFHSYSHSLIEMTLKDDQERQVIFSNDELPQLQNLEKLKVKRCESVVEVFDMGTGVRCSNSSQTVEKLPKLRDVYLDLLHSLKYIWKSNDQTILEFPNLTKLYIYKCKQLEHVFTCSMVGSLLQLKELTIRMCKDMEVIVKEDKEEEEEGGDGKVNEIIRLPCLKALRLDNLNSLKGFCLGNVDYSFPSLDRMKIEDCKSLTTFTKGGLSAPGLKVIATTSRAIDLEEEQQDINSYIITKTQEITGVEPGQHREFNLQAMVSVKSRGYTVAEPTA